MNSYVKWNKTTLDKQRKIENEKCYIQLKK